MTAAVLALVVLAQVTAETPAEEAANIAPVDARREEYLQDAAKYTFQGGDRNQAIELIEQPIMRWANDDDWSGDVFVWASGGLPQVIGCILSGPSDGRNRLVYHEFHLLGERPIAGHDMLTRRRWQPSEGLTRRPIPDAARPADSARARIVQMRQLARRFSGSMEADGDWELRLLTQPLHRYGDENSTVVDGALFAYVWTKGTDPELILLIECHKSKEDLVWKYAPVRFSNRKLRLHLDRDEVWQVEGHKEPASPSDLPYTTAYARLLPVTENVPTPAKE